LPLLPFVKANLVDSSTIIADSKSGVSGAGRGRATQTTHYCHVNESFKAYNVGGAPSYAGNGGEDFARMRGCRQKSRFVPHLLPMTKGMESTVYVTPSLEWGTDGKYRFGTVWNHTYLEKTFVSAFFKDGQFPGYFTGQGEPIFAISDSKWSIPVPAEIDSHVG
jgi:N-acetyl-gamma-glutamyl-phosphate reductase